MLVNLDYDEEGVTGSRDNQNNHILQSDNDIVTITIEKTRYIQGRGMFRLLVDPEDAVRLFIDDETIVTDFEVDFASPFGDMAGIAFGNIDIFVEGLKPHLDVKITGQYLTGSGHLISSDSVHLLSSFEPLVNEKIKLAAYELNELNHVYPNPNVDGLNALAACEENQYWRFNGIGLILKEGVNASDAITHIFENESIYRFECASAAFLVWFKSILDTYQECDEDPQESAMECYLDNGFTAREIFDERFSNIIIAGILSELNPIPYFDFQQYSDYYVTDWRYIINPACDIDRFPAFRGEHVIQMSDSNCDYSDKICMASEEYYGHVIGSGIMQLASWYGYLIDRIYEGTDLGDPDNLPIIWDKARRLDHIGLLKILMQEP